MQAVRSVGMTAEEKYRISGHESFPCRYTWLPKAVQGLSRGPKLFADEEQAMVDLGVGKNMVRSIRFWAQASGLIESISRTGYQVTDLGRALLGERGVDPFLEDIRTLWLIHWAISTNTQNPLLAWDFLFNHWQEPDLVPSQVLTSLQQEAARQDEDISPVTVEQHFETFLHTYIATRGRKRDVQEDNLDCPLVELELIIKVGERALDRPSGRHESVYSFRREEKPEITPELFACCLNDFWQKRWAEEDTLPLREVAHGHGSPGQIFKLPEEDIRVRVEALASQTAGFFSYVESTNLQQVRKHGARNNIEMLKAVYSEEARRA